MRLPHLLPLLILASCTVALHAVTPAHSIIGTHVPEFVIDDQFEHPWNASMFRGGVTVYVLSDRSGYEYSGNWTTPLLARFRNSPVRFVPVADVQSVPGFLKGLIRGRFRDEFNYSVLMDWDGVLIKAFNMQEDVTNLVIANKSGIVEHVAFGTGTSAQVESFAKRLEVILAQ
ncbi:MAG TPA: hypothetical protein VHI13_13045 [Candidatus Kapabacteria bacterium]|nr:hypothetical protein [Candidatus Kapabacteria bacterium]